MDHAVDHAMELRDHMQLNAGHRARLKAEAQRMRRVTTAKPSNSTASESRRLVQDRLPYEAIRLD